MVDYACCPKDGEDRQDPGRDAGPASGSLITSCQLARLSAISTAIPPAWKVDLNLNYDWSKICESGDKPLVMRSDKVHKKCSGLQAADTVDAIPRSGFAGQVWLASRILGAPAVLFRIENS